MFTRRSAIGCATAAILTTPSILRAHTEDTFVLPEQFQPKEVRVREQYTAGMILVSPHQFYLYHIFETERAIRYGVGVGRAGRNSREPRSSSVKRSGRPGVRQMT
jgi:hypothetical protein